MGLNVPKEVSGAGDHTCARTENGSVYCWGDNSFGQGGVDPTTLAMTAVPQKVNGLPGGAVEVTVGNEHSCAQLISGDVYCWGHNDLGELGDNAAEPASFTPIKVQGLK
jgi:alpha-tubulin suppressor-like RCC1 family protein